MKIYVLIPCYFDNRELELLRLERLFKSLDKAIDNTDLEIDVRICGLYGSNQNKEVLIKNHNYLKIVSKGTNYPDNRRHLLMKSIMGGEEMNAEDRFVFLDADDIISDNFFKGVEKLKNDELGFVSRFSILSSDDGTLGIQLPPSEVSKYSIFLKDTGTDFKRSILSGNFGGQIWGVFFSIKIIEEVYNDLPYISMWEDVRFWMCFGEQKIKFLEGRYYWVRNNKESLSSNLKRTDLKFAMNVQEIIWELQRRGWDDEDIFNSNLIRYARLKLDGQDFLDLYDYDEEENITEPTDRRLISVVDKKVDMLPSSQFWTEFPGGWSGNEYCYKNILDDFLYRII